MAENLASKYRGMETIINDNYPSVEPLIKFLDCEDAIKVKPDVKPPKKKVREDIEEFRKHVEQINKLIEEN